MQDLVGADRVEVLRVDQQTVHVEQAGPNRRKAGCGVSIELFRRVVWCSADDALWLAYSLALDILAMALLVSNRRSVFLCGYSFTYSVGAEESQCRLP